MRKFLLPIIVVIAAVLYSSVVVVTEGSRGIMLRADNGSSRGT